MTARARWGIHFGPIRSGCDRWSPDRGRDPFATASTTGLPIDRRLSGRHRRQLPITLLRGGLAQRLTAGLQKRFTRPRLVGAVVEVEGPNNSLKELLPQAIARHIAAFGCRCEYARPITLSSRSSSIPRTPNGKAPLIRALKR